MVVDNSLRLKLGVFNFLVQIQKVSDYLSVLTFFIVQVVEEQEVHVRV